jgi:DNA-binding MarR family transcriptional regulator
MSEMSCKLQFVVVQQATGLLTSVPLKSGGYSGDASQQAGRLLYKPHDKLKFVGYLRLTENSSGTYSSHVNEICGLEDVGSDPLVRTLLGAAQRLEVRVEAALGASGLSLTKLAILHHLIQAGEPLPLSRLADKISCVKSNITQLMDRLEGDGLVARASHPDDRRSIRAEITTAGRHRYKAGAKILAEQEEGLLKCLRPGDRHELAKLLDQLCQ